MIVRFLEFSHQLTKRPTHDFLVLNPRPQFTLMGKHNPRTATLSRTPSRSLSASSNSSASLPEFSRYPDMIPAV